MVMRSPGYSLSEAMITVLIVGILAGASAPLLVQMTNFWRQTTARNEIQRDVRASLDAINRFTRQASQASVVIDQLSGQPSYSRITFQTVACASCTTTGTGETISFWQNGANLYMKRQTVTTNLSHRLAFVAFTYPKTDDSSIISVAMTMEAPTYLGGGKALQLSIQKVRVMNP